MLVEYKLCFLLLLGLVSLAASDSKVYILSSEALTSLESSAVDSQELRSKMKGKSRVNLYSGLFHSRPIPKLKKENKDDYDKEYDYDGYFRKDDRNKFCYGHKCYLYLPDKKEFIETSGKDTKKSRPYSAYLVKGRTDADYGDVDGRTEADYGDVDGRTYADYGDVDGRTDADYGDVDGRTYADYGDVDGYERDDESNEDSQPVKRQFLRCPWKYTNNRDCYRRSSTTTKPTTTQPTTTKPTTTIQTVETTTREKTIDEKTTAEVTSSDLDAVIPDNFEQRAEDNEGERKFSTDYIDIDDLYTIFMRSNGSKLKKSDDNEEVTIDKAVVEKLLAVLPDPLRSGNDDEADNKQIGEVYSKKYLRELRRPDDSDVNEGRKWGIKKAKKKRYTTPSSPYSDSSGDDTSNIRAEDSSMENSESQSREKRRPTKDIKKENRFKVVKAKKKHVSNSMSRENGYFADSSETIEPVSIEVKPKPKKKSKSRIPGKPESYIQSFSRLYKEGKDFRKRKEDFDAFLLGFRKRMPHFMPKRYHWDASDFHKLGYFWFNGPQGKAPGPWKIAY